MKNWWRRVRGAMGTGITWALVWAPVAIIVGTQIIDPTDAMDEMWWMVGAMPGFIAGVTFSVVLSFAAQRRRLRELSITRVGVWGALAGAITGTLPFLLGDRGSEPIWPLAAVVIPTITLLSALSAAGSLALAKRAERNDSSPAQDLTFSLSDDESLRAIHAGNPLHAQSIDQTITAKRDATLR